MKKLISFLVILSAASLLKMSGQTGSDTSLYLITCGPGLETYSHYGHSALRVTIDSKGSDVVYNWGVFDFSTPNFGYRFAKGKLDYLLDAEPSNRFIRTYMQEERWVVFQKINLSGPEKKEMLELININLRPENIKYRYDFFYDDCSTRIRDLLEKVLGSKLVYTPAPDKFKPTFRYLVGTYQEEYPWLDFGIDLLMGTPADRKATDREKMFLPLELKKSFTGALVNRNGKMAPLLQNQQIVLDFPNPSVKNSFILSPFFIFTLLCIGVIIFSAAVKGGKAARLFDIVLFSVFSLLAIMLLFTNFISAHHQMKYNLSLLWLSPFLPVCLYAVIGKKEWFGWFRTVFILSLVAFAIQITFPVIGNNSFIPLILIVITRSSVRAGYSWNPLSLKSF